MFHSVNCPRFLIVAIAAIGVAGQAVAQRNLSFEQTDPSYGQPEFWDIGWRRISPEKSLVMRSYTAIWAQGIFCMRRVG